MPLAEALVAQDAGVVDQNIYAAPLVHCLSHHALDFILLRHVGAIGNGLTTGSLDFRNNGLRRLAGATGAVLCSTKVIHHDLCTTFGQFKRMAASQPLTRACHDCHFAIVSNRHFCFLFPLCIFPVMHISAMHSLTVVTRRLHQALITIDNHSAASAGVSSPSISTETA